MRVDFTQEMVFGFSGPNLSLLGNEGDFKKMAQVIIDLTVPNPNSIEITSLDFVQNTGDIIKVLFRSQPNGEKFGIFSESHVLVFELDDRYWERIFKFFVLMSWDKKTYYLNSFEDCLRDLPLDQECHLICSSEFGKE